MNAANDQRPAEERAFAKRVLREFDAVDQVTSVILFGSLAAGLFAAFWYDITPEATPVANTLLLIGVFAAIGVGCAISYLGRRAILREHDLRCPTCGAVPQVRYVKEMLRDDECPNCCNPVLTGILERSRLKT